MASIYYQSIADGYPFKINFNLNFQLSKPSASSQAATCSNE